MKIGSTMTIFTPIELETAMHAVGIKSKDNLEGRFCVVRPEGLGMSLVHFIRLATDVEQASLLLD